MIEEDGRTRCQTPWLPSQRAKGWGTGMIQLAVELVPVNVAVLDWGTFVADSGPDDGRAYGWISLDTMNTVETIQLASEVFGGDDSARATFETYSPLETETDPKTLQHWGHPLVRVLISKKPTAADRMLSAFAFHLCARCEDTLLQALTTSNKMAITGPVSSDYDDEDDTTWPTFVSVRTILAQISQAELGAWRQSYKKHADEGDQLSIYSEVE